jgi:GNAT superfamily N-acetyltransferase
MTDRGGFVIRDASLDDMPVLRDIFRTASLSNERDRDWLLANPEILEYGDANVRAGRARVAVRDGTVVGFASTLEANGALDLDDLFVHPDAMREGIGTALVADAAALTRDAGFDRLTVSANDHALTFYESAGFVTDGWVDTEFRPARRLHLAV